MNGASWAWLAVAALVGVGDWLAVHRGAKAVEYVCKPLTMVALAGVALALDPAAGEADARGLFVVALILSLAGDVFLMLPQDLFVAGLASFLLGHVAYIAGLARCGVRGGWLVAGALVMAVAVGTLGRRIVGAVRAGDQRPMTGPVVAYMAVISVMVLTAVGTADGLAAAGALLFYCSDALIAWTRFVQPLRWGRLAIIVTYHVAQAGLVVSLVR